MRGFACGLIGFKLLLTIRDHSKRQSSIPECSSLDSSQDPLVNSHQSFRTERVQAPVDTAFVSRDRLPIGPQQRSRVWVRRRFLVRSVQLIGGLLICSCSFPRASANDLPTRIYDVRAQGAKGDGTTVDTDAINRTILAASAVGGGVVLFPPGTYLSASIHLRSNITLKLEAGATIEGVDPKIAPYDLPEPNPAAGDFQDYGHSHWQNSLIWGIGLENVSILGPGRIYGRGLNPGFDRLVDETKGQKRYQDGGPGNGNKAIALRDCNNVILRDFAILHGGHFGILATGVANLTIDNLKIDTNRDGMDVDACLNVRISNCSVNSPWDDGICLKASYGLGKIRHCDNITISDCYVCGGFDEGTLLDATFKRSAPEYRSFHTGRIKLGTESNGDFKNIAITNCVFDDCCGIAVESVDGSHIEDVAISNITMRHVANSPIFIRLGSRLRGPGSPPVGSIRRIRIDNIVASDAASDLGCVISGIPEHAVEDIAISNVRIEQQGGGPKGLADRVPPEEERGYPEPNMFGKMPSYAWFVRHARGIEFDHIKVDYVLPEARPAVVLEDVSDARFDHVNLERGIDAAPLFDLRHVSGFSIESCKGLADVSLSGSVERQKY